MRVRLTCNEPALIFVCVQVGIATEKVVNIDRLVDLAAAELFVASAPREVKCDLCLPCPVVDGDVYAQLPF